MYLMYADESGNTGTDCNNEFQKVFTLAGIVIPENDWYDLNNEITKRKKIICSDLETNEIHANDIFQGSKNQKIGYDFRKNSIKENLNILEQLVDLIAEFNLPIFNVVIHKPNFKDYIKEVHGDLIKIDPYLYAFSFLSIDYNNYLIANNKNGMLLLDENVGIINSLDTLYSKLMLANFENDTNNIIENVLFLQSKKNNFIQLADICNFYINKYYSILWFHKLNNELKNQHCIDMYNKLRPLMHNCKNFQLIEKINKLNT